MAGFSRLADGAEDRHVAVFDDKDQLQTVLGAVMDRYNDLIAAMDAAFERIEAKEPFDYRPLFLAGGAKAKPDIVRLWARGFGKAMALGPEGWISLAEHERLQLLLAPFIGFLDIADPDFVPADDIDERLDEAAAVIPHATVVLRKLAQMRSAKPQAAAARGGKPGRNAPCPCGSGLKYKRCCGAN
ncbi:MAG: SEC-C domain-containing protein [Proteobacteria bacterium]|nr:SEC-C domain-containing protein [Pseudomonadota bacterium]